MTGRAGKRREPQQTPEPGHLSVTISGSPDLVARLIGGLAATLGEGNAERAEPERLLLSRREAAGRLSCSEERLSALVKAGRLTNHGTPGKMLFSLVEIRAMQQSD